MRYDIFYITTILFFTSCLYLDKSYVDIERTYYNNGILKMEIEKIAGKLNGKSKFFDQSSNLISIANYSQNILHGNWEEYYKNGIIKYKVLYNYGFKHGTEIRYYENGNIKSETRYNNGDIISETLRWDNEGNIIYK